MERAYGLESYNVTYNAVDMAFYNGLDSNKKYVEPDFSWEDLEKKFTAMVNEAMETMKTQYMEVFQEYKERYLEEWKYQD
jgi:hypothetical protein